MSPEQLKVVADGAVASTVHAHAPFVQRQMKTSIGPEGVALSGHGPSHSAVIVHTTPFSEHVPDGNASLDSSPPRPAPPPQWGVHFGASVGPSRSYAKSWPRGQRGPSEQIELGVA